MSAHAFPSLKGIRVLDFTQFLSGPYCTQIFADLGAEVIKVESPQGDLARFIPPHFVDRDSVYYLSINRNKRSIAIDLKTEAGLKLARDLVFSSDIVVENYRPGVMDKLGLSATELLQQKQSLIWCSISGFGQTGPYRDKPAYDMIVQALSGGMSLTGEPGRSAVRAGIPIGDIAAGMYAIIGALAALHRLKDTGKGEIIDVSMLDCQAAMLCYQAAYYLHSGVVPGPQGSGHDSIATYRTFVAKDGVQIVVTANTERMWHGLCNALGLDHLPLDSRFKTVSDRYEYRHELWPLLEEAFLTRPASEWVPLLDAQEVPVGVVNTLDLVAADPHLAARDMIMKLTRKNDDSVSVMGSPIKMNRTPDIPNTFPPRLGENTDEILGSVLGMSQAQIDDLKTQRVVVSKAAAAPVHPGKE